MPKQKEGLMSYGYGLAPNLVLFSPQVSDKQFRIYVYLLSLCASNGFCRPTDAHIGAKFGINRQNTNLHINALKSLGLIKIEEGKGKYKGKRIIRIENNIKTGWDMPDIDLEMEDVSGKQDLSGKQDTPLSGKQDTPCLKNKTPLNGETQVKDGEEPPKISSNITNEYYNKDIYSKEYISVDTNFDTNNCEKNKLDYSMGTTQPTEHTPAELVYNQCEDREPHEIIKCQVYDGEITAEDIRKAYKVNANRKGKESDVIKLLQGKSQEEMKQILLEMQLLTFENRFNLVGERGGVKLNVTCENAIRNMTYDEVDIQDRVEKIIIASKNHKYKNEKYKLLWQDEITTYFKDYITDGIPPMPTCKEEWLALYDLLWHAKKGDLLQKRYPEIDAKIVREDRCTFYGNKSKYNDMDLEQYKEGYRKYVI